MALQALIVACWYKGIVFFFTWKRLRSLTHSISEKSVFFFSEHPEKKIQLYFFSQKKDYTSLTHSFQTFVFFFPAPEKKNTVFLLTHSILDENVTKVIFSRNKKKIRYLCISVRRVKLQSSSRGKYKVG